MSGSRVGRASVATLAMVLASAGCAPAPNGPPPSVDGAPTTAAPLFTPTQAWVGRPFYPRRVAEQADAPEEYAAAAKRLRFKLESHAVDYAVVGSDTPLGPRSEWAVPMGTVNGSLAVLTSRCEIDYRYPLRQGEDPRFRNLAIFDSAQRTPRTVFMLAPIPERPELSEARDPRVAHVIFDNRFYLDGPDGDRYFGVLASGRLPRVTAQLIQGEWGTNDGIDLVMLYFPLSDPAVAALQPSRSLGIADPLGTVKAAMANRTDYLGTFSFNMITPQCLHAGEAEFEHETHEARLWEGIAIVAVAAAVLPLLGPALAGQGGLAGFAGQMAIDTEHAVGPKILAGFTPTAWQVVRRALSGEQLADVIWDEGGHLVINAVIDGAPRRLAIAGVHRGTAPDDIAARVLATVREWVRDRAGRLVTQTAAGHPDVSSLIRPDVGADLATELLASGLAALDTGDRATLARQPTLIRAAAYALQGVRGPAVQDTSYQSVVQQLALLAGS